MDQKHSYHSGKWITLIGFCTAMEIILARFLSLHTWNLKIGLSFLPVRPPCRRPDRRLG